MPFTYRGPTVSNKSDRDQIRGAVFKMVGASRSDKVSFYLHAAHLWDVTVESKNGYQGHYYFDWEASRVMIWWIKAPAVGKGWGSKKFLALAKVWRAAGFEEVYASPADRGAAYTGYYFWPKMGFTGIMEDSHLKALPKEFRVPSKKIEDLFALEGGPAAWKEHGSAIWGLKFDLTKLDA